MLNTSKCYLYSPKKWKWFCDNCLVYSDVPSDSDSNTLAKYIVSKIQNSTILV